jgi:hypothetical protein
MSIITRYLTKPNPKDDSGLNFHEVCEYYPEFWDTCDEVIFGNYPLRTQKFVMSVLEFLEDWTHISWKQFTSVMKIHSSYKDYENHLFEQTYARMLKNGEMLIQRGEVIVINSCMVNSIPKTDKAMDGLFEITFGSRPTFYEEERGLCLEYTRSGNRIFTLPTSDNIGNIWD